MATRKKGKNERAATKRGIPYGTYQTGRARPSKNDHLRVMAASIIMDHGKVLTIDLQDLYDYVIDEILNDSITAGALKKFDIRASEDVEDDIVDTIVSISAEPSYPAATLLPLSIFHLWRADAATAERFARIALHGGVKDASVILASIYDLREDSLDHVRATDMLASLAHDRPDVMFIMGVRKALGHGTERDAELGNDLAVFALRDRSILAFKYPIDLRSLKGKSFETKKRNNVSMS
ncbi:MAG: hypothetical protein FWD92_06075 [Methanomassiliicoccaceae archaeon]|nr:hypothetical protein [Methanomassiliicoccaceae archaeon]